MSKWRLTFEVEGLSEATKLSAGHEPISIVRIDDEPEKPPRAPRAPTSSTPTGKLVLQVMQDQEGGRQIFDKTAFVGAFSQADYGVGTIATTLSGLALEGKIRRVALGKYELNKEDGQ